MGAGPQTSGDSEGWSERLKAVLVLAAPGDVDEGLAALIHTAWERS